MWLYKPYYWNTEYALRYLIPQTSNVIAISSFLENYYHSRGCNTLLMPPLYDYGETSKFTFKQDASITLSYTGSPGAKDNLNEVVESVLDYNSRNETAPINFEIAGINEEQLLAYPVFVKAKIYQVPQAFKAHGNVPMEQAKAITAMADFSILFRNDSKVSKAGFPTKVVESLSVGTPILLNISSDLASYLSSGWRQCHYCWRNF
jgi:hypothetical protein